MSKDEDNIARHRLHMHAFDRTCLAVVRALLVGVNAAMSDHAALAELLIKKGVITESEYLESIAYFAAKEHSRYEDINTPVKFGGWDDGGQGE